MNWRGFRYRIFLVGVAFPLLGVLILALPQLHHLGFNIIVVAASVLGALETAALFRSRGIPASTVLAPILAASMPVGAYLEISGLLTPGWLGIWIPTAICILLMRSVFFRSTRTLRTVLSFASSSLFIFIYPGLFLSWIVRISSLPDPSLSILYFLCLVFSNDMSAYFAGSLWGRSSRLNLAVSPQKSIVGFGAGLAGSLLCVGVFYLLVPWFPPHGIVFNIVLGLATGAAVILGDLVESGLKRSAGVKDSGGVIPGRGGMLDSVDSMLFTAPLFYYLFVLVAR